MRADVAPKDESAGTAADWRAKAIRMLEEMKIQLRARDGGDPARREFWADVGRRDSDRLRTSADQQTMAPKGASMQVGEARTSGRKADKVQYDWRGGAIGALPDVDRSGPVADVARIGSMSTMDFQAALPVGGAMPTSEGDTGGGGDAGGVAEGVAGGRMPTAYKRGPAGRRDRTWPRAEPMMTRRTPGRAVTDFNLPDAPEGSSALPQMWR